uniref:DUF7086 domain-containing protein n=1 Tax=Oryza punctata TaxID=4537 RepID=A0A0E0JMR1_ORYPU
MEIDLNAGERYGPNALYTTISSWFVRIFSTRQGATPSSKPNRMVASIRGEWTGRDTMAATTSMIPSPSPLDPSTPAPPRHLPRCPQSPPPGASLTDSSGRPHVAILANTPGGLLHIASLCNRPCAPFLDITSASISSFPALCSVLVRPRQEGERRRKSATPDDIIPLGAGRSAGSCTTPPRELATEGHHVCGGQGHLQVLQRGGAHHVRSGGKFREVCDHVTTNIHAMDDRALEHWLSLQLPNYDTCEEATYIWPHPNRKREINRLFLFLVQMIDCCTLDQLKFFCKNTWNHHTGAKNRMLYYAYIEIAPTPPPSPSPMVAPMSPTSPSSVAAPTPPPSPSPIAVPTLLPSPTPVVVSMLPPSSTQLVVFSMQSHFILIPALPPSSPQVPQPHLSPLFTSGSNRRHRNSPPRSSLLALPSNRRHVNNPNEGQSSRGCGEEANRDEGMLLVAAPFPWVTSADQPVLHYTLESMLLKGITSVGGAKPLASATTWRRHHRETNWLFLFLGQMLGCCTLEGLKFFCKNTKNHCTGAKNRVLYYAYIEMCRQLDPQGPFNV